MKNNAASSQLLQSAQSHYASGQVAAAEKMYKEVLQGDPASVQALHMLGVITLTSQRYAESIDWLKRAIKIKKDEPLLHFTLGLALQENGELDEALSTYENVIRLKPDYIQAHLNIGFILDKQEKFDKAELRYKQVIVLQPSAGTYLNLGRALKNQEKFDQALDAYKMAITLKPDYADAYYNLGNLFKIQEKFDEAIPYYAKTVFLKPDMLEAYNNLGITYFAQKKFSEAAETHRRAIALKHDDFESHSNLGAALYEMEQFEEAIKSCHRALEIKPDHAQAYNTLGSALNEMGETDGAIAKFHLSLEIDPTNAEAHNYLANSLRELGKVEEAIKSHRRAAEIKPDDKRFEFDLGFALLLSGQLSEGWQKYEARWEGGTPKKTPLVTTLPQWAGQTPRPGDRLLITCEQGLGDQLQFSRYFSLAADKFKGGVTVIIEGTLLGLMQRSFPGVTVLKEIVADPNTWQWHCPLMSLPLAFGTTLKNIPARTPYLVPDPVRVDAWKEKIATLNLPARVRKIGIAWKPGAAMKIAKFKAVAFQQLLPLLEQSGAAWFSLQKDPDPDNIPGKLIDWSSDFKDFDDTAALMMNLDLIISVDTSVAHLAGGLNLPTWLLNRYASDWRWMRDRDDSPWYPSMRIFTQEKAGDWESVVKRMIAEGFAAN